MSSSYQLVNRDLKPLSSQRASRFDKTSSTNFFGGGTGGPGIAGRESYKIPSLTSFEVTEKSRLEKSRLHTYGSEYYFNQIETEQERAARFHNKMALALKKRTEAVKSVNFSNPQYKDNFGRIVRYFKEFYSSIIDTSKEKKEKEDSLVDIVSQIEHLVHSYILDTSEDLKNGTEEIEKLKKKVTKLESEIGAIDIYKIEDIKFEKSQLKKM